MFGKEGNFLLGELFQSVFEFVDELIPDSVAQEIFERKQYCIPASYNRFRSNISRIVFEEIVSEAQTLIVTSVDGISLRIDSAIFETPSNEEVKKLFAATPFEPNYLFIHPQYFYVSTSLWNNHLKEACKEHLHNDDFVDLEILAQQIEKFEGWGLSIGKSEFPESASSIRQRVFKYYEDSGDAKVKVGRPRKVDKIAAILNGWYPEGFDRPSWKEIETRLNVEEALYVSTSTVSRAWTQVQNTRQMEN